MMTKITVGTPVTAPLTPGMDTGNVWPTHSAEYGRGGLKLAANIADRDSIPTARRYQSLVIVLQGADKYPHAYYWSGKKEDGSDGAWVETYLSGGFVLADTGGGLPELVHTLVFGDDFEVQKAGDQGGGALITLAKTASSSGGMITVGTYQQPQTFGKGNILELEWPLKAWPDADKSGAFRVSMDHSAFEPMHKPSFLAYLGYKHELIGKVSDGDIGHHKGAIWFDDVRWPGGPYIAQDKNNKAYGIEEADDLDPNISGGTDYLISFVANFSGIAPSDGTITAYLYNKAVTPISPKGYLLDKNGEPMAYRRAYKKDEKLENIFVSGVVNAKGDKEFTCHIIDDFADDNLILTDPYYGETGLMIQALTTDSSTGVGRLQFEQDTGLVIHESKNYLGADRCSINYIIAQDMPMKSGAANAGLTMEDGLHFHNISPMKIGVVDGHLVFQDDGVNICDFTFGKIFDAEETMALRGKTVTVSATLTDKNAGWNINLMKWTGDPDQYTKEIMTSRNNLSPVFQANWTKVDSLFVSEDVVSGDHDVTKDFVIPADANNYAIIILPVQSQQPLTLKLKKFQLDVKNPFIAYSIRGLEKKNESHLVFSDAYKEFIQGREDFYSLRYTINDSWTPMPTGEPTKGNAKIVIDPKTNQVTGSSATGGEGAYQFKAAGNVSGYIDFLVWNEQKAPSEVTFKLVSGEFVTNVIDADGGIEVASVTTSIPANSKGTIVRLHIPENTPVLVTERWGIVAKADKKDGAFLECNNNLKPLVKAELTFKELIQANP